ncbi:N-acetylmuramate alpha-1-phosphate uridylyltransferase MurU [Endozoicomonas sp.]|uniref:N-acetylmuramate alpha-1-phosphate uridylyltransferase MurU n=1 Tax=Endozoicomonas sp. TaxID=1892382 RepID=UPI00383BDF48
MKAMILAAGYGKRLRPITLSMPKPLVPVAGKPLITYHIERLAQAGFRELVINHGWLGEQIEQALGSGSNWGVNIQYSPEDEPLETGGGIFKALPMLGDKPFIVMNGDVYTNVELGSLKLPEGMLAHLVMVDNPDFHPDGDFCLSDERLFEKDEIPEGQTLTFSGVSVLSPRLFDGCQAGEPFALAPLLIHALKQGRVSGQYHDGFWTDVGSIVRLQALEHYLQDQLQEHHQDQNQNNFQDQSRTS